MTDADILQIAAQVGANVRTGQTALRFAHALEIAIRKKIVQELRSSAFLHTDVNKEHVLLAIEHGGTEWYKYVTRPDDDLEPLTPGLLAKLRAEVQS